MRRRIGDEVSRLAWINHDQLSELVFQTVFLISCQYLSESETHQSIKYIYLENSCRLYCLFPFTSAISSTARRLLSFPSSPLLLHSSFLSPLLS